ncbi:inner membrane protein YpjD [Thiomicrorhabdus indica]|uniref:cytochrome C assembly family protein n=1 Tax=Thiomicrorhabdus indica TaxID=2267253 RepID=UPI00102DFC83|nr:cytochrome c biogenesis protein CcsA [Thiomicrorhabdus indica]
MVFSGFFALSASLLYVFASLLIWQKIKLFDRVNLRAQRKKIIVFAVIAAILHVVTLSSTIWHPDQYFAFNLSNTLSLITLLAAIILLGLNRQYQAETLGIFIFPVAALTTMLPIGFPEYTPLPLEIGSHVFISIAAYSLLGLATAQAILYSIQEKRFHNRQLSNLMRALPPLQIMEELMFKLLIIGFVFLSFSLLSGAFFVEDIFAQHLVHKTFFAVIAWILYGVLLTGRFQYGWRGQKAVKYTIWAYGLLVVSFVGTELVLQCLLDMP